MRNECTYSTLRSSTPNQESHSQVPNEPLVRALQRSRQPLTRHQQLLLHATQGGEERVGLLRDAPEFLQDLLVGLGGVGKGAFEEVLGIVRVVLHLQVLLEVGRIRIDC